MRSVPVALVVSLFVGVAAAQQPVLNDGPLNAASVTYSRPGQPNAGIAQGSMLIVKGQNLGTCGTVVASSFPLKTTMGGTSMKITMAGNTYNVFMYYVVACTPNAPDQLAGVVPSNTPVGLGSITVTNNGRIATAPISIVARRFGIYARNGNGTGPLIVQNFNSATDQPVNSLVESAHPGQSEILWGNGLGAISGDDSVPPAGGDMNIPVDVFVGGKPADVAYKGRTVYPSVDVIVFKVPDGVQGCYVPIAVRVAGVIISNSGTISVTPSGKACSDPTGFSSADLQKVLSGGTLTVADITLLRISAKLALTGMGNFQGNLDFGTGAFQRYGSAGDLLASVNRSSVGGVYFNRGMPFPSVGCAVTPFTSRGFSKDLLPGVDDDPVAIQRLDAGAALNLTGPLGAKPFPRTGTGTGGFSYDAGGDGTLGGGIPGLPGLPPPTPEYLAPGSYTLNNGSGGVVGGFSTSLTIPTPAVWNNQDALSNILRSQDMTVTWSGGAAGAYIWILGSSADPATGAGAEFICTERADAGTFTVPAWVLSAMPASGPDPSVGGTAVGFLTLQSSLAQPARFQATGIDVGFFNWTVWQVKNVKYQ